MLRNRHSEAKKNSCPSLKALSLSKVNLSCEDLSIVVELFPKLEYLNISRNEFESIPECIRGLLQLKNLDVSFCRYLKETPLSIQTVDARYCQSLTTKSSSMLLSKVNYILHYFPIFIFLVQCLLSYICFYSLSFCK